MKGTGTYIFQYASVFLFVPEPATSKKTGAFGITSVYGHSEIIAKK